MDGIGVLVYDPTNTTLLGQVFPSTINVSAPLGGKGTLTMMVPPTDPLMVATPTAMDDCVFRVSVPDGAGGTVTEAFANRMPCKTLVALDNGELNYDVVAAGLDVVWGRDAVILPEYAAGGDMPPAAGRERQVGWAASMYDPADDPGFWDDLIEVPSRTSRPTEPVWPTGTAAVWITCSDVVEGNRKLYRAWLDVPADNSTVAFYVSGDEALTLWVAGEAVLSTDDTEVGKKYTRIVRMTMAAGTYAVGIDTITRVTKGGDGYDPVILAAALTDDDNDLPVTWLLESNDTTFVGARIVEDTGVPPGPTVGQILTALHAEAQGIDIATWDALALGFDAAEDTDGVAWAARPEMVLTYAGDDYATIWDRLSDTNLDMRITPYGVLEARQSQGVDLSASVTIDRVTNIDPMVEPALGNTVHTLTLDGWITVKHLGQYTAQGRRPMFLQLGTAASTTQGGIIATNSLPDLAFPQVRHNVSFWATPGAYPLVDYGPGDVVAVSGLAGTWRVLALTATWDGTTEVAWVAEVAEP